MSKPLVVCCSQRFKPYLQSFIEFLEKKNVMVFYPDFRFHRRKVIKKPDRLRPQGSDREQAGLVLSHLQKIDEAHSLGGVCLIYNPLPADGQKKEFGYVGDNTLGEVFYSRGIKIPIIMIKPTDKRCIMALVPHKESQRTLMKVFTAKCPKGNTLDNEFLWDNWLRFWLNGTRPD